MTEGPHVNKAAARASLSNKMNAVKRLLGVLGFKKDPDASQRKEEPQPTTEEKIRAFGSIVSILSQIHQKAPFRDEDLANKNPPNPEEMKRLKLLNAFAHLAVAHNHVVAATYHTRDKLAVTTWVTDEVDDDQEQAIQDTQKEPESKRSIWDKICWLFTFNTTHDDMNGTTEYQGPLIVKASQPTGYPTSGSPKEDLLQYLKDFPKQWNPPSEESHLWVLAKMLTTLQNDDLLLYHFMKYVVAATHRKIQRRFETKSSKEYLKSFEAVQDISRMKSRTLNSAEIENDRNFLTILTVDVLNYEKKYPNIANIAKLLKELPGSDFELFNSTTCKEYHQLFLDLMHLYKTHVDKISDAVKAKGSFEDSVGLTVRTGHALLTMVKGRAFYRYLSSIASELSKEFPEQKQIELEKQDDDNDTSIDPEGRNPSWKPFRSWVMLMLVHLNAADALCAFVKQAPLSLDAEIDVKVVYSSLVTTPAIPLERLLTQPKFIPEAKPTESKTNAQLLDFIKTANTLKVQAQVATLLRESTAVFKERWDVDLSDQVSSFIKGVLEETQKEHEEDKQAEVEDARKNTISELCHEIQNLLQDARGADIPSAIGLLEVELKERHNKYDLGFSEREHFKGALHCEACLATILDKQTRDSIKVWINSINSLEKPDEKDQKLSKDLSQLLDETQDFTHVIGISKRCCPVCRRLLAYLSLDGDVHNTNFVTPGFHNNITSCTLPAWTPDRWVNGMNETFGGILREELANLASAVQRRGYRDRVHSSGSGVSVGNSATVVGKIPR